MDLSRRTFLASSAACVACAGCGDGGGDDATAATTSTTTSALPRPQFGFGSVVDVGPLEDIVAELAAGTGVRYVPEARTHLVHYPDGALAGAREVYDEATLAGMELGLVALYQKCTHLGCRVPECTSSGRFECQCHGAVFNRAGEYVIGPAPRGLDRFAVLVDDGRVAIDTSAVLEGLPRGTTTVSGEPIGAACIATLDD